jgi:hypothetical protein
MRTTLLVLTPLLLAGCIKQSASYYVSEERDHAITVRAEQEYFWDESITLSLVSSHFPECQRAMPMEKVPKADVAVELFSSGDGVFTVRSGTRVFQVDSVSCTQLPEPAATAYGEPVGVFMLGEQKMEFAPAAKGAAAPAA